MLFPRRKSSETLCFYLDVIRDRLPFPGGLVLLSGVKCCASDVKMLGYYSVILVEDLCSNRLMS